jgi:two-component system, OmpR family, sensor kinase
MTADPGLRQRMSTQARAVRTRIAAWVVLLTALALVGAGIAVYVVVSQRISERISQAVQQELAEFETLQREGFDPDTSQSFTSAEALMRTALERNVPDANETIIVFLEGEAVLRSPVARPTYAQLGRDPSFAQAVRDLLPQGGAREIDTPMGEAVMAVKPVEDAVVQGAYVPVYFTGPEKAELTSVMRTYTVVAGLALVLVTAGAWLAAGRLLQPLREMRSTAQEISDSDLSRRLDITGNDDLTELGTTFNAMLDRLEGAFAHQRRFLDDAGHELRTPITIVRGHLELLDPGHEQETQATRDLVLDEVDRMARLVDDMIVLAKSGRPDFLKPTDVDAGILTDEVLDKVRALGDRKWKLDQRAEGTVCVDPQRVTQALLQLATNAVRHTCAGAVIALGGSHEDDRVRWWVRDTGPGVEPHDTERIFERFQRGDQARGAEGSGLGLSIVRAIATAHGGDVHLDSVPGEGATFTLDLPASGRPEHEEAW